MSKPPLTPERRALLGRIGGYAKSARVNGIEGTEAARAAGPGRMAYWEDKVDPTRSLPEGERERRAEAGRKAHFSRLAYLSARARSSSRAS
jgi:hypothetical protein